MKVNPAYALMSYATETVGMDPADFLFACASENKGQPEFIKVFQGAMGKQWYDKILQELRPEIEEAVVNDSRPYYKRLYRQNMDDDNRKFLVHRYIRWVASYFWDNRIPTIKEVKGE